MLLPALCPISLGSGMIRVSACVYYGLESSTPKMPLEFIGHHSVTIRSVCCLSYRGVLLLG